MAPLSSAIFIGVFTGFVINISIEDNFRSVGLGVVNLHQRCGGRHHDGCLYTVDLGGVSDTLRVVSGGSGYRDPLLSSSEVMVLIL